MGKIEFSQQDLDRIKEKLIAYCQTELDVDLGGFDAQFLLEFIGDEFGAYYYNQGLYDAQAIMGAKMDSMLESVLEIEKEIKA